MSSFTGRHSVRATCRRSYVQNPIPSGTATGRPSRRKRSPYRGRGCGTAVRRGPSTAQTCSNVLEILRQLVQELLENACSQVSQVPETVHAEAACQCETAQASCNESEAPPDEGRPSAAGAAQGEAGTECRKPGSNAGRAGSGASSPDEESSQRADRRLASCQCGRSLVRPKENRGAHKHQSGTDRVGRSDAQTACGREEWQPYPGGRRSSAQGPKGSAGSEASAARVEDGRARGDNESASGAQNQGESASRQSCAARWLK